MNVLSYDAFPLIDERQELCTVGCLLHLVWTKLGGQMVLVRTKHTDTETHDTVTNKAQYLGAVMFLKQVASSHE